MNNELLALLAKMGCTVTEENGKIVIEQGKKEEQPKEVWKPKNGDICVAGYTKGGVCEWIYIHKEVRDSGNTIYHALLFSKLYNSEGNYLKYYDTWNATAEYLRPATEEEKKLLFDALANDRKQWNAENKCIEDLPYQPKHKEFVWCWDEGMPPFERCGRFYDLKHRCTFNGFGKYCGYAFTRYEPFEGELPKWAKEAVNKLED